jgi:predicted DNA-binding protein
MTDLEIWIENRDNIFFHFHLKNEIQPRPVHNNPEDYGLTKEQANNIRLRYLSSIKKELKQNVDNISNSIIRTQRIIFTEQITDRIESLADKMLVEPIVFEIEEDEEDEDNVE